MSKRAVIYGRVSTDKQAEEGTSLKDQIKECEAYAARNNMEVIHIAQEDYSGDGLDRPELNIVMDMLRRGAADSLIVYKTDRTDRSWAGVDYMNMLRELREIGIEFHKAENNKEVDLNDPSEVLIESIEGWQAGTNKSDIVRKLARGRRKRAELENKVVPIGNPPYGYKKVKGSDNRWYFEIIPDQAQVIRDIFTWYTIGDETQKPLSIFGISERLTAAKIPTAADINKDWQEIKKNEEGHWARSAVARILENETYAGTWYYGKRKKVKIDGKIRFVNQPKSKWLPVDVPAIVSRELWDKAQQRRSKNQRNFKKHTHLLAGFVNCQCGRKMSITVTQSGAYFRCNGRHDKDYQAQCDFRGYFKADNAGQKVWDKLGEIFSSEELLKKGIEDYRTMAAASIEPLERELRLNNSTIHDLESALSDLFADYEETKSKLHKAHISKRIEQVEAQLLSAQNRRDELQSKIETETITAQEEIDFLSFAQSAGQDWQEIAEDETFESQRMLFERINLEVELTKNDNGEKIANILAKISPKKQSVVLDDKSTGSNSNKHYNITASVIL